MCINKLIRIKTAVRAREVICLLGIFLEHAHEDVVLSDFCQHFDRTIFTIIALNPVLRLGMLAES